MSTIVAAMDVIIDFAQSMAGKRNDHSRLLCSAKQSDRMVTYCAYFVFLACAAVVALQFTDHDFSLVLTSSAGVQCLGFFLLNQKVRKQKSCEGLSSKTLEMYCLFLVFRLGSTLFKNGYLPVDRSGDWVYQVADIGTLLVVLHLLYAMHRKHPDTYDKANDSLPIFNFLPACVLLAVFVHGDLNDSPFFDVIWTISMYLDTIAMLPQLYLMMKKGGEVEALTSHFVACLFVSRACSFAFWFYGYVEISPAGSHNAAGLMIILAHSLQLFLCADFMYYYVRSVVKQSRLALPSIDV